MERKYIDITCDLEPEQIKKNHGRCRLNFSMITWKIRHNSLSSSVAENRRNLHFATY